MVDSNEDCVGIRIMPLTEIGALYRDDLNFSGSLSENLQRGESEEG